MRCKRRTAWAAMSAALLLAAGDRAVAQVARSGGAPANSQLMMQMQQLGSEKTRLEADNSKLKKDLEEAQKQLESLKNAQKTADAQTKGSAAALTLSKTERDTAQEQLKQTKDKLEQLIAKFRETAQTLRDTETDRAAAKQALATRDHDLKVCAEHNASLFKLNEEVLARLEHQGFWSRAEAIEPFTQLKRRQNENLADDDRARAQEQRVAPPVAPAAATTP